MARDRHFPVVSLKREKKETNSEIIICTECKGVGKIPQLHEAGPQDHFSDWYTHHDCKICGGVGRMKQITTVLTRPLTKRELNPKDK